MEDGGPSDMFPISQPNNDNNAHDGQPPKLEKHSHKHKIQECIGLAQASFNAADIDSAVIHLAYAAEIATKHYGENSKEAVEPLFLYGSALLGRALYNDEHMSSMPREQAMWFESVTGHPMPDPSVAPRDIAQFDAPKELKKLSLPSGKKIAADVDLALEILKSASVLCKEHDELLDAVISRCLEVAEVLKTATKNPAEATANLKRVFEREFPEPDYVKRPRMDLA